MTDDSRNNDDEYYYYGRAGRGGGAGRGGRGQGNAGRGRYRRMYELTGVPGWIRFGSSPGFAGGGRGMGPCAEYLQKTGQLDQFIQDTYPNAQNAPKITNFTENQEESEWIPINQDKPRKQSDITPSRKEYLKHRIDTLEEELRQMKKELRRLR
jgi:hypothetical protein